MGFGNEQMSPLKKNDTFSEKGPTIWHTILDYMDTVPKEVSGLLYFSTSVYIHYLSKASKFFKVFLLLFTQFVYMCICVRAGIWSSFLCCVIKNENLKGDLYTSVFIGNGVAAELLGTF